MQTKEITELLDGVKAIGVAVKKIMADGKIGIADLPVVVSLLSDFKVLSDAVAGADQIPAEVKDLDAAEVQALVAKCLEVAAAIKAA